MKIGRTLRDSLIELVIPICSEPLPTAGYGVSNKALRKIAVGESYDRCLHYHLVGKVLRARLICRLACVLTLRKYHHIAQMSPRSVESRASDKGRPSNVVYQHVLTL
jgi:hypothetical protein